MKNSVFVTNENTGIILLLVYTNLKQHQRSLHLVCVVLSVKGTVSHSYPLFCNYSGG